MSEEKTNIMLNKIETLITDGNKTVLGRLDKVESRLGGVETRLGGVETRLDRVENKIERIDKKHDMNATAMHDLLQDVKKGVGEVKEKLDAHLRVPHAVCWGAGGESVTRRGEKWQKNMKRL